MELAAKLGFVGRAIQFNHRVVNAALIRGVQPLQSVRYSLVDIAHGGLYAFAQVASWSPSRSSTASCSPVEAPLGTAARPIDPSPSGDLQFDRWICRASPEFHVHVCQQFLYP